MKILFFGDIVGSLGREAVVKALPGLTERYKPDLVIANAENLAHGAGVTEKTLNELVSAGVHAFTGGNHSWNNPLGVPIIENPEWQKPLIVPTNYGGAKGGRSSVLLDVKGTSVLLLNVMGQLFTHPDTRSPFDAMDAILKEYEGATPLIAIVDVHAEATAEKEALGHHADGRVSAVLGTHTHVPTADAKILPGGTAYVTDVGRCGSYDSVVGFDKKTAVQRFLNGSKKDYSLPKTGKAEVNAIVVTIDIVTGLATGLDRIREIIDV